MGAKVVGSGIAHVGVVTAVRNILPYRIELAVAAADAGRMGWPAPPLL